MSNKCFEEYKEKWRNKTKKQKIISVILMIIFALFTVGTILSFIFADKITGENSIFKPTDNSFLKFLFRVVPALIESVQIIILSVIAYHIVKWIASILVSKSNKGVTVIKLLSNFLKYVVGIVAILLILSAWGVDTTTLIAGAGVLSLVIGLGAQSLVSDIIAGIFIVFEGAYKIGDIVVIDGWRGTVQEIGIRSTKIKDAGGNVKIINNSAISSVINQTQDLSLAKCTVGIEYGEDLQRVEKVIKENLEHIGENIPEIIDVPMYKGVSCLNASSVDLLLLAYCKEEDIYGVQRALNREIKLLFDANDINIPFMQVVVHKG